MGVEIGKTHGFWEKSDIGYLNKKEMDFCENGYFKWKMICGYLQGGESRKMDGFLRRGGFVENKIL